MRALSRYAGGEDQAFASVDVFHHEAFHANMQEGRFSDDELAILAADPAVQAVALGDDPLVRGEYDHRRQLQEAVAVLYGRWAAARVFRGGGGAAGPAQAPSGMGAEVAPATAAVFERIYDGTVGARPGDPRIRLRFLADRGFSGPDDPDLARFSSGAGRVIDLAPTVIGALVELARDGYGRPLSPENQG